MRNRRFWLTLGLGPALLLAVMVLPLVAYFGDLPNPMATHWDLSGEPNGSMPPTALLILLPGIFVAVHWAVGRSLARLPYEAPSFVAGLFAIGASLAGVSWLAVFANRNAVSWEAASGVGVLQLVGLVTVALAFGYLGWYLAGGGDIERDPSPEATPTLEIAEPSAAVWSSRGSGRILQVGGLVLILVGLAMWSVTTVVLLVLGLVVLANAEVRVTVSKNGAVVSLGWLGIPSWTVPLSAISQAEVETVNPMAYGGWGYRLRPGVRAVVTRGGESLRLVRPDQPDLLLTVDDAATGAGLINAMLEVEAP